MPRELTPPERLGCKERMGLRYLLSVVAGAGLMALLVFWRGFPYPNAFIVALGGAALVYTVFGAVERLRRLHQ